ncbi:gamma-glutamylcyclotransferase [Halorussus vallis]|uniref:gamma-glutamylcyclotransferase family protein n=2 Tax=Halorussus TaxID=1070314 RepID=UPI00209CEDA6|nr:gamma-glutamylcyclotransferase family protein [Halorussus vallis]USZ74218.1 gamma-glutamylcyclotransferase [Halorussus vallis]
MDAFVYGTLTDPDRVSRVVSAFEFVGDATLDGLRRVEGQYPTLAPGGTVSGRILRTPEIEALDAYEGVERGLYVRVGVPRERGKRDGDDGGSDADVEDVAVYVGDPEPLGADADWPGQGPFAERVRRYVRERGVVVRTSDR